MIQAYFEDIEKVLQNFPNIQSYTLSKKLYNDKQGFIRGIIKFEDNSRLDNAPHHKDLNTWIASFSKTKRANLACKTFYRPLDWSGTYYLCNREEVGK